MALIRLLLMASAGRGRVTRPWRQDCQQFSKVRDGVVRGALLLERQTRGWVEQDRCHADLARPDDVRGPGYRRQRAPVRRSHPFGPGRDGRAAADGFAKPVVTGDDNGVEVVQQPDLVQFTADVGTLGVADDRQRIRFAQNVEDLAGVRVQAQSAP